MMTLRQKMLAKGRQHTNQSCAQSFPVSEDNAISVLSTFTPLATTRPEIREQLLRQEVVQYGLCDPLTSRIMPVACVASIQVDGALNQVGNMSDKIGELVPILLGPGFTQHFLSYTSQAVATNFHLPFCTQDDLDMIPPHGVGP